MPVNPAYLPLADQASLCEGPAASSDNVQVLRAYQSPFERLSDRLSDIFQLTSLAAV